MTFNFKGKNPKPVKTTFKSCFSQVRTAPFVSMYCFRQRRKICRISRPFSPIAIYVSKSKLILLHRSVYFILAFSELGKQLYNVSCALCLTYEGLIIDLFESRGLRLITVSLDTPFKIFVKVTSPLIEEQINLYNVLTIGTLSI